MFTEADAGGVKRQVEVGPGRVRQGPTDAEENRRTGRRPDAGGGRCAEHA